MAEAVTQAGIIRNLSLKLTQLGLDVDRASAVDNLRKILERADGFFIRIDMESSAYTQVTLDIFEILWEQGYRNIGVVLQADLYRTAGRRGADQPARRARSARQGRVPRVEGRRLPEEGGRRCRSTPSWSKRLLERGHYPAIATHDVGMIDLAREHAAKLGLGADAFEFQMLYGIRRDLQTSLVEGGLPRSRLRAVRPAVVPLLHAPAWRATGQHRIRAPRRRRRQKGTAPFVIRSSAGSHLRIELNRASGQLGPHVTCCSRCGATTDAAAVQG